MSRVIKSKFVQLFESVFLVFKEGYFLLALIFLSMFLLSSCDSKTEKEFSKVELTPEANELVKNLLKDKGFYINNILKDLGNNDRCIVSTKI